MKTHDKTTRYKWTVERDHDYQPEGCDGKPLPEAAEVYAGNEYYKDGKPLSYVEYRRTYGNPNNYVGLVLLVYRLGPEDVDWVLADSCGTGFMADDAEVAAEGQTVYRLEDLPGHLRELAQEMARGAR